MILPSYLYSQNQGFYSTKPLLFEGLEGFGMRQETRVIVVVCVMCVSVWALANLMVNSPNLDVGSAYLPETPSTSVPQSGSFQMGSSQFIMYILYGFVLCLLGMFVAVTVYAVVKRDKRILKEILVNLLAGVLVVALFMGAIAIMKHVQDKEKNMPELNNATGPAGTQHVEPAGHVTIMPVISLGMLVLGVGVLILFVYLFKASLDRLSAKKAERKRVAGVISQTILEIERGEDFRAAILRCYRKLCELLSRHGLGGQESLTPRELESVASEKFGIRQDILGELTALFEEARYSVHDISLEKKQDAIKCLVDIKNTLERKA